MAFVAILHYASRVFLANVYVWRNFNASLYHCLKNGLEIITFVVLKSLKLLQV